LEADTLNPLNRLRLSAIKLAPCLLCLLCGWASIARAELAAENVIILANSKVPESLQVAKYYQTRRKISEKNLITLPLPAGEQISREDFRTLVVKPLRDVLRQRKLTASTKVIVTVYGVPLVVAAPSATELDRKLLGIVTERRLMAREGLLEVINKADSLLQEGSGLEITAKNLPPEKLIAEAQRNLKRASERVSERQGEESIAASKLLGALALQFGGLEVLRAKDSEKAEILNKKLQQGDTLIAALDNTREAEQLKRKYNIVATLHGAAGMLLRAGRDHEKLSYKDALASFDSELSLLWWDEDMYPLAGRLPSPVHYSLLPRTMSQSSFIPVMMVSRLDGPNPGVASGLVRQSLVAEKGGLKGLAYLDARGMKFDQGNTYSVWDQNIRDLAWVLREHGPYKVRFNDTDQLIDVAENTAIYAGWYQLRKYKDVFSFEPGAIGYHIASEEALSVRDPKEPGWCKNMLERGITATLGAVGEPYLDSFPLPQEFFGLMMSGRYHLVEAYYLSTPYISWKLVLFGDPLYNPWKDRGFIEVEDLEKRTARDKALEVFPLPLGELNLSDPAVVLEQAKANRRKFEESLGKRIRNSQGE
jgi:uncharacterized protein (TIGR03790 family)